MNDAWKNFWEQYAGAEAANEDELYRKVGKIANSAPVSRDVVQKLVDDVADKLELTDSDTLLEMCCGNGLITHPLSEKVKKIYAFDFTESLIASALQHRASTNIEYVTGNAKEDFTRIFAEPLPVVKKFLIHDSTAYFLPEDIEKMIEKIKTVSEDFMFYLTHIPNNANKWLFYNTPERKEKYEASLQSGDIFLGGIGRWWDKSEFTAIAEKYHLHIEIFDSSNEYAYRMSILLSSRPS